MTALLLLRQFWYIPVMAIMTLAIHHYRTELRVTTAEFESYQSQQEALEAQAKSHKIEKESSDATRITSALSERDVARNRVRELEKTNGQQRLPILPTAAQGTGNRVCLDRSKFESAFGKLNTDLQGIAEVGDLALIDNKAWLSAWPR